MKYFDCFRGLVRQSAGLFQTNKLRSRDRCIPRPHSMSYLSNLSSLIYCEFKGERAIGQTTKNDMPLSKLILVSMVKLILPSCGQYAINPQITQYP